ncbi:MAG: hypothetical protein RBQ97_00740 [Acholeplasma sp.]|nr:hypothetical protein [Acholeplasma sp.]
MKENKNLKDILYMVGFIVVFLGVIIGLNYALKSTKANNEAQYKVKKYETVLNGIKVGELKDVLKDTDDKIIKEKYEALNVNNKVVAILYEATKDNQYGSITIRVAIDAEGKIIGVEAEVDQSISPDKTKAYVEAYKGSKISSPKADGVSMPSVGISVGTANEIFSAIAESAGIVDDIFTQLFGEGYSFSEVTTITEDTETVKGVKDVLVNDEVKAQVYILEGKALYNTTEGYGSDEEKSIELQLIVEPISTRIIGYYFDMDKYHHTKSYITHVENYLNALIKNNVLAANYSDIEVDAETGGTSSTGSLQPANTVKLVRTLLNNLKNNLGYVFGEEETVNSDAVKTKQEITVGSDKFYLYYLEDEGIYETGNSEEKSIGLYIIINAENKVVSSYVPLDKYHHTKSNAFMKNVYNYINGIIKNKVDVTTISSFEVDSDSGATGSGNPSNSVKLLISMIKDLGTYVGGDE